MMMIDVCHCQKKTSLCSVMGLLKQGVQNLKKKIIIKTSDERLLFKALQASETKCSHICEVAPVKESSRASKCHYAYMPEPKAYLAESFQNSQLKVKQTLT